MENPVESLSAIQVVKLIGKIDEFPHSLVVECSDNVNRRLKLKLDNSITGEQRLKLTQNRCMLVEGSELDIEIHKKQFKLREKFGLEPSSEEGPMPKANIKFDDLRRHLSSRTGTNSNFEVKFDNPIQGLQLWLVIESHDIDLNALKPQIREMMVELNNLESVLHRLVGGSDPAGMLIDLMTAISKLNPVAHAVLSGIQVLYNHFKNQNKSCKAMKDLANSVQVLASQLERFKEVPISDELRSTIKKFPVIMKEVVIFIRRWLKSWMFQYIFVDSSKEKAIELKDKLDTFKDEFDRHLRIETFIAQTEKKELGNLIGILERNSSSLHEPCMSGTRTAILQKIENDIKNVNGRNVIWIRGSPGVGKSALAASIATRLQKQSRPVISFRFDRTQSSSTDTLWCAIALGFARLYPLVRQHIHNMVQGNTSPYPHDTDDRFQSLIEMPLSTLNNDPPEKLPVIVIDALDECDGLRDNASGRDDFKDLVYTLKRWVQADHLKKLKLVITSRSEDHITRIFSNIICIHVNIPSGNDVEPEDNVTQDIRAFLKSRLESMGMKRTLIEKALDCLVPRAAGIFIWATTVANFLKLNPEGRFAMLEKGDEKRLTGLYPLCSIIVKTSFGDGLMEEETRAVVSVIGAMIFAKEPLSDNVLIMLPNVRIPGSDANQLGLIRKGLMPIIDSGPVLRFHHRFYEDFLLSESFLQDYPGLSAIQDRVHHEHQLTMLCLKTLVSPKLHFNMCSLESSIVKNVDIQASVRSAIPPLVSYSCQYWADHLAYAPSDDETLMEVVRFVMHEKLLFWIEVMSLLGKAHEVALILQRALSWKALSPDHELVLYIRDALRFISAFIVPISQCAPQIYISALSFAPKQSLVAKKFFSRFPNTAVVTEGKPRQWPMVIFTAGHHKDHVFHTVFSPDESTFASISTSNDRIMLVYDSETGRCISGPLELPYNWSIRGACFSPDGKSILLKLPLYAVVLDTMTGEERFRVRGWDFVIIGHDGRIASIHWIDKDGKDIRETFWGNSEDKDGDKTGIVVRLWNASNGALISNKLFEVNDVARTQFSPDGHFLAVERKSEYIIELWNLEDGKDPRQFSYPPGDLRSLDFSPTSDSLMAVSRRKDIYLWRLDTQEMASFSHDFNSVSHVIHSLSTDYLFIKRPCTLEIWDISVTGTKPIWESNPPTTSPICSTCPSRDGHRLLVGCEDGSVRMWDLDLKDLAMNQASTMDTQADADMPEFAAFSRSGKIVATKSKRSQSIEVLDTATKQVIACTDFDNGMDVVFSPDEDQVALWSDSLITVCDVMHLNNRVSFKPWARKDIRIGKIAFRTRNDLVICAISHDDSALLQVWHRQDPTGFECTYSSLDFKADRDFDPFLAPDGLTVITVPLSSSASGTWYSWNHNTAQFHPIDFDDQVHIRRNRLPAYSPDGKFFSCWSRDDSHVRVWDTQTGRLVSKFPTSEVHAMALSPTPVEHPSHNGLIALFFEDKKFIYLLNVYTGHLYAKISGRGSANMAFIRDGTELACYFSDIGLRTWDIADPTDEHWYSVHGYKPIVEGMQDGWLMDQDDEPLFWVPIEHRDSLYVSTPRVVFEVPRMKETNVDLSQSRLGGKWVECIDKKWLREVGRKEEEVGDLLEKYVLSSAQVFGDVQMDRWTRK